MSDTHQNNASHSGINTALAALTGYTAAAWWGHLTFDGDLPWRAMTMGMVAVSVPVAFASGFRARRNEGRVSWPHIFLICLAAAIGAMCGIVLGS